MPRASLSSIELDYETFGPETGPPLLLIRGLGTQRIQWPEGLLDAFVARGFCCITFDNRDVGRSTWFDDHPVPVAGEVMQAVAGGGSPALPYTLADMADDCVALLDVLGVARAHVLGMSMGGMIAQLVALRHQARAASLVSVMSATGGPGIPGPSPEAAAALMEPTLTEREPYIEQWVRTSRVYTGTLPFDADAAREIAGRCFDRAFHPDGVGRQLGAVLGAGSRREALAAVTAPSLVVHGDADPLVPLAGGEDTAKSIPGAELLVIEGMGHDLPLESWAPIADAVGRVAARAG